MGYISGKNLYSGEDLSNWTDTDWANLEKDHADDYAQKHQRDRVYHEWKQRRHMTNSRASYYKALVNAFGEKCAACGCTGKELHIDHKTPISKGGFTDFENLQLLCKRCNSLKTDMLYYEWLPYAKARFK